MRATRARICGCGRSNGGGGPEENRIVPGRREALSGRHNRQGRSGRETTRTDIVHGGGEIVPVLFG